MVNIEQKSCKDERTVVDILTKTRVSVSGHNTYQILIDCFIEKRAVKSQECSMVAKVDSTDWTQMVDTFEDCR